MGLTATPKDYLKSVDVENIACSDPRQLEKRMMLDTYTTFGCYSGEPTFRYSLEDGVVGVDTFDAIGVGNGGNGERVLQEARSMLTSGFLFLDTAFDLSESKIFSLVIL